MFVILHAAAAHAEPYEDPYATARTLDARAGAWDTLLGGAARPIEDAARLTEATGPLAERLAPEVAGLDATWRAPAWVVRPAATLTLGDLPPTLRNGDPELGLVSARASVDAAFYASFFEARLQPRGDVDLAPTAVGGALEQYHLGVRTRDVWFGLSKESRWVGPGRHTSLLWTDNADPLPGLEFHGDWRWPGKADVLGRFGVDLASGIIPGPRDDVSNPAWLLLDLRWAPVPFLEVGATRNGMFGGRDENGPRPIDFGQLILPTDPHVYGDEQQLEADTDERVALDVRLTLPFAKWVGGPLRYVEVYAQHGGEDIIANKNGVVPLPGIAGTANLYGAEIAVGPAFVGVERAVLEDDYMRWYTGHRIYHQGWTKGGQFIGNPYGGDTHTWWLHAGARLPADVTVILRYEHAHEWHVVDLVQDSLFVLPYPEVTRLVGARGMVPLFEAGFLAIDLSGGRIENDQAIESADRFVWRAAVDLDLGAVVRSAASQ
jgi:hypothetical protein